MFPGSHGITAAGKIIGSKDAWGRTRDDGTNVHISTDGSLGNTATMNKIDSKWFDSDHAKWLHPTQGAKQRFNNFVKDYQLGAETKKAPSIQSFKADGYYAEKSALRLNFDSTTTSKPWANKKTFWNAAEHRAVEYLEIDVALLRNSNGGNDWPTNGAIYSDVPIALINADNLKKPPSKINDPSIPNGLSVVSDSTIYTRGDFNMNFPTPAHKQKNSNANFFKGFYDTYNPTDGLEPQHYDRTLFESEVKTRLGYGSPAKETEWTRLKTNNPDLIEPPFNSDGSQNPASIYLPYDKDGNYQGHAHVKDYENRHPSALMTNDRIYHVSEGFDFDMDVYNQNSGLKAKAEADDPKKYDADENQVIEINAGLVDGVVVVDERRFAAGSGYSGDTTWENSDDFLEWLDTGRTVRKRGSIVHLGNAEMSADFNNVQANTDPTAGISPWIVHTAYIRDRLSSYAA